MDRVHIATVGVTKEPIIDGILYYKTRPDKVYLIHTEGSRDVANDIVNSLKKSLPHLDVEFGRKVNEHDLEDILEVILTIIQKEKGNEILINITGGTKVMAGAALATAYFSGVKAYYIPEGKAKPSERIRDLPIPSLELKNLIKDKDKKILSELLKQEDRTEKWNMRKIANELGENTKSLSYYMGKLENQRLVKIDRKGRIGIPSLSHTGKLLLLLDSKKF